MLYNYFVYNILYVCFTYAWVFILAENINVVLLEHRVRVAVFKQED